MRCASLFSRRRNQFTCNQPIRLCANAHRRPLCGWDRTGMACPQAADKGQRWPYGLHSASPNGRQIAGLPATVRADGMRWERTGAAVYADMRYCSDPYSTSYSPSTDLGPSTPSRSRLVTVVLQSGAHGRTASAPSASVRESAASFDGLKESRWMEWQSVARRARERVLTSCVPSGVPARFPAAKRAPQGRV